MIRITKQTDYGIVLLTHLAADAGPAVQRSGAGRRDAAAAADGEQDPEDAGARRAAGLAPRRQGRLRPGAARRRRSRWRRSSPRSRGRSPSPSASSVEQRLLARGALPGARQLAAASTTRCVRPWRGSRSPRWPSPRRRSWSRSDAARVAAHRPGSLTRPVPSGRDSTKTTTRRQSCRHDDQHHRAVRDAGVQVRLRHRHRAGDRPARA